MKAEYANENTLGFLSNHWRGKGQRVYALLGPLESPRRLAYLSGFVALCFAKVLELSQPFLPWVHGSALEFWSGCWQKLCPTFQYDWNHRPGWAWSISYHGNKRKSSTSSQGCWETILRLAFLPCSKKDQPWQSPLLQHQAWVSTSCGCIHKRESREAEHQTWPSKWQFWQQAWSHL